MTIPSPKLARIQQHNMRLALAQWQFPDRQWRISDSGYAVFWRNASGVTHSAPDYFIDLNVIAEAVSKMNDEQWNAYHDRLFDKYVAIPEASTVGEFRKCFEATATQRAEALCQTLWPERIW